MASTSAKAIPMSSGKIVRTRCWPIRVAIWGRLLATHPKSKIFVPGGISDPQFDGRLIGGARVGWRLVLAGLVVAGDERRGIVEGGGVLAFAHLARDRLDRDEPEGPAV